MPFVFGISPALRRVINSKLKAGMSNTPIELKAVASLFICRSFVLTQILEVIRQALKTRSPGSRFYVTLRSL